MVFSTTIFCVDRRVRAPEVGSKYAIRYWDLKFAVVEVAHPSKNGSEAIVSVVSATGVLQNGEKCLPERRMSVPRLDVRDLGPFFVLRQTSICNPCIIGNNRALGGNGPLYRKLMKEFGLPGEGITPPGA